MDTKPILTIYQFNKRALLINLDSISEDDCKKMPAPNLNSLNWILGHIVLTRDEILGELGKSLLCSDEMREIYKTGEDSRDLRSGLTMHVLLEKFNKSQSLIEFALENPKAEALIYEDTLNKLGFYAFHEAYHVGQTAFIRKLLGKKGQI